VKLLREITDKDFKEAFDSNVRYNIRKAARAVVINETGKVAVLYASKNEYYKLPGGGIEDDEDNIRALHREIMEEVGVEVEIIDEIGLIIEYRIKYELLQISYCYLCKVKGEYKIPTYTANEINEGFELKWLSMNDAISKLNLDLEVVRAYGVNFIITRDMEFLKKANEIINK
jgi:8-oxo-dGTP diphosphatase